jgi:hypothetical protein
VTESNDTSVDQPCTVHRLGENPCKRMAALVRYRWNVYYQVDYSGTTGGKYKAPESHYYTQTENIKQLRAACNGSTFTVYVCVVVIF